MSEIKKMEGRYLSPTERDRGRRQNLFPPVIDMKIYGGVGVKFASLNSDEGDFGWGLSTAACEINGVNKKNLLAMVID